MNHRRVILDLEFSEASKVTIGRVNYMLESEWLEKDTPPSGLWCVVLLLLSWYALPCHLCHMLAAFGMILEKQGQAKVPLGA